MSKKLKGSQIKVVARERAYSGARTYRVTHTVDLLEHEVGSQISLDTLKELSAKGVKVSVSEHRGAR